MAKIKIVNENETEIITDRTSPIFRSSFEIVWGAFVGTSKLHQAIRCNLNSAIASSWSISGEFYNYKFSNSSNFVLGLCILWMDKTWNLTRHINLFKIRVIDSCVHNIHRFLMRAKLDDQATTSLWPRSWGGGSLYWGTCGPSETASKATDKQNNNRTDFLGKLPSSQ
jgi:hypothetical protein